MLVPAFLCEDAKTVTSACKRHITRFKQGGSWIEAGPMVDVGSIPGLIMVGNPSPHLAGVNVRLYAPFWELDKAVVSGRIAFEASIRAFDEALGVAWSLLGLLSQACYHWLLDSERAGRFLKAIIAHWEELDGVGPRYTCGLHRGQGLWEHPHLLKFVLARRGVAQPRLVEPLPAGGIADLLLPKY